MNPDRSVLLQLAGTLLYSYHAERENLRYALHFNRVCRRFSIPNPCYNTGTVLAALKDLKKEYWQVIFKTERLLGIHEQATARRNNALLP